MDRSVSISLGGHEYEIHRVRLGKYLLLQEASLEMRKAGKLAAKGGGAKAIINALADYLGVGIPDITPQKLATYSWLEIISAFSEISLLNKIDLDLAILKTTDKEGSGLPEPWEYSERIRYYWIHIFASTYNWSREEIENLWPEDAYAFLQEIIADDQQQKEFMHSLSEVAYHYDQATKKSKYKPLARPSWMIMRDPKSVITRLPALLMPVGDVQYPKGQEELHPAQNALIFTEEAVAEKADENLLESILK